MITTNTTKKELIQKLLDSKSITLDDAFMLLDEKEPVQTLPYYPWPGLVYPTPSYPWVYPYYTTSDLTITTSVPGTMTLEGTTTDTVIYTQEQIDHMHRSGQLSYTTTCN